MTDDDLYEIVAAAASLPAPDIEKLVAATGQGQQALRLLRSRTSGGLRQACSTVLLMADESSLAELCGILKGADAAGRVGRGQVDLVWTGPDVPGSTSRLTSEVIADLVDQARSEVLLISFAMHSEPTLTAAIARAVERGVFVQVLYERAVDNPMFKGGSKPFPDLNIRHLCWPIERRPPGASMHAKALVIDRRIALIGSANITGTAMLRNLECGVLLRDKIVAEEIWDSIASLLSQGVLEQCGS